MIPASATTTDKGSFTEARAIALKAIDLLLAHGIPPSPLNYAVSYEHLAGAVAELSRQIDARLAAGHALDAYFLRELYDQFLAADRYTRIHGMRADLQNLIASLMQTLATAGSNTAAFQQVLEHGLVELATRPTEASLLRIAAELLEATQQANRATVDLETRLQSTREEAEHLRLELEQQRLESLVDPLTGLYNRRAIDQFVTPLLAEGEVARISLLLVDIDHFKRVNDTYGHDIGDVVIRQVVDSLRKCIRGDDIAIRYGGEEFLVVLPNTPATGAIVVAEAIRRRVEALRLVRRGDNLSIDPFTVSVGVASLCAGDVWETFFQRADRALYQAKAGGRNRTVRANGN